MKKFSQMEIFGGTDRFGLSRILFAPESRCTLEVYFEL
jgi:hypothetical protein